LRIGLPSKRESAQWLIPIINGTASIVVAVSCDLAEINGLMPDSHGSSISSQVSYGGVGTPYALCCHAAMCSVADLVDEKTDIAYFFESGDDGQPASQRFIAGLAQYPLTSRGLYKLRSHHVLDKRDSRLFEMSDIAAWEWSKHVQRTRQGLHMRPSLSALLGDRLASSGPTNLKSRTRRGWHLTGEPLAEFYKGLKDRGVFDD
jgi:hypothetical protein